jgi:hypothetical protein
LDRLKPELSDEEFENLRSQIVTSNWGVCEGQNHDIICSARLFGAGLDKLSVVICVNPCPFAVD